MKAYTQRGRITSLFGTYLPPKKKQTYSRYLTFRFKILGTVPSKKNRLWADSNLKFVAAKARVSCKTVSECVDYFENEMKVYIRNGVKYKEWHDETFPVVREQFAYWLEKYSKFGIVDKPLDDVSISVYHYWNNNEERDLSGKLETLQDLFVNAEITTNDAWQQLKPLHSDAENYKDEILDHITTVDITYKMR
jgi:hypothetical protein